MNSPINILVNAYRVSWADMCCIRRTILSVLVTCLVGPILYLVGFGYGLGSGLTVEGRDYIAFLIPGIISMTTMSACFSFTSSKIFIQKTFYRSIDEMLLCPIPIASVVLGKSMMGVVRGMISCAILMVMASFLSKDFHLSVWLVLCVILSCFAYSFLGVAAGMLIKSHSDSSLFAALVITPMTFLCGTIFSLEALPAAAKWVVNALPLTHTTNMLRALSLGTEFPWVSLLVILCFGAVFFLIPYRLIKKGKIE